MNDGLLFNNAFYKNFKKIYISESDTFLSEIPEEMQFPFVGDYSLFTIQKKLIKTYSADNNLTTDKIIFNYRLSRGRRIVNNAFGIVISKFYVL